jgi:hypothetical protein
MKEWIKISAVLLGMAGLLSGCTTRGVLVSDPVAQGAPHNPKVAAGSEMRYLNLNVNTSGSNEDGGVVAGLLKQKMVNELASQGLVLSDRDASDLELNLQVQVHPFDQSGNYYVYEAEMNARANLVSGQARVLGQRNFQVRSERKLGKADALRSAADEMEKEAKQWCMKAISPASFGLMANDVTVKIPALETYTGQVNYAKRFIDEVSGLDGVVTCRVMKHNYDFKQIVFRVVYFRDSFPAGLLNTLSTINKLNLKAL